MSNYFITTPIYYVNDRPHIGHAYTSLACDVTARFKRLSGFKVKFLTGTDEHGQKVEKSAAKVGISPQQFVDNVSAHFREMAALMKISNDDFIRTTEPRHIKSAQALWKKMSENGHIYLSSYSGWYSVRDETYYQEAELIDKKAPTGADVEWVEEPSYFFDLSKWQERLLAFYEENPDFIKPESRRNEIISFVKSGLRDLSISRTTFSWGIPVPDDNRHIMYVWLDALANYLSALDYPHMNNDYEHSFWPADLHMVGKDIIRFHSVYWPAFLMAADLLPPRRVFAHGWWTIEGEKMSKSLGNVISPADLVSEFGLDQTRWFLLREVPFGNDGNFSRERMVSVINGDLANNIGNLVQRTLAMIAKNCEGMIPDCGDYQGISDDKLRELCYESLTVISGLIDENKIHLAVEKMLNIAIASNGFIDKEAPWALKKSNPQHMNKVLYTLAEAIRCLGIYLSCIMPDSAAKILDLLAVPQDERSFANMSDKFSLKPETKLPPPAAIFPRIA